MSAALAKAKATAKTGAQAHAGAAPGAPRAQRPSARLVAALAITLAVLGGCSPLFSVGPSSPEQTDSFGPRLMAGVAVVDITPPIGLALFGHGPEGRLAVGTLLRLQCKAFVLTQEKEAVALVPCDLGAVSLQLQRRVAEKLEGLPIGADRLWLMATHTHAGPGHYFGAAMYSGPFGQRLTGYDPQVVEWLAERIAGAVRQAYGERVAARAAWTVTEAWGLARNRSMAPFGANRWLGPAPGPELPERDQRVACQVAAQLPLGRECPSEAEPPPPPPAAQGPSEGPAAAEPANAAERTTSTDSTTEQRRRRRYTPAERAVDPTLAVLRIDDFRDKTAPRPLGVFVVFGVHPTAIPNTNDLYHGDVFGYASRAIEHALDGRCPQEAEGDGKRRICPVVGIANGIDGDASPAVDFRAPREARRLGQALAARIVRLHSEVDPESFRTNFPVGRAYRELWWPNARASEKDPATKQDEAAKDDPEKRKAAYKFWKDLCPDGKGPLCAPGDETGTDLRLCTFAAIGTPAAAGAVDGPTRLRVLPQMNEGVRAPEPTRGDCQGAKLVLHPPAGLKHWTDEQAPTDEQLDHASVPTDFPSVAPISLIRLGNKVLATAPAELTTVVGVRLRTRLTRYIRKLATDGRAAATGIEGVVVVGLTNDYVQYIATAREYELQHYEGASTLYGPSSERFLSNHFVCLASTLFGDPSQDDRCRLGQRYEVNQIHRLQYDPPTASRLPERPAELGEGFVRRDLVVETLDFDGLDSKVVRWRGLPPPEWVQSPRDLRVRVVRVTDGQIVDHDNGSSLEVRNDDGVWSVRWFPTPEQMRALCDYTYRFEITAVGTLRSENFTVACLPARGDGELGGLAP